MLTCHSGNKATSRLPQGSRTTYHCQARTKGVAPANTQVGKLPGCSRSDLMQNPMWICVLLTYIFPPITMLVKGRTEAPLACSFSPGPADPSSATRKVSGWAVAPRSGLGQATSFPFPDPGPVTLAQGSGSSAGKGPGREDRWREDTEGILCKEGIGPSWVETEGVEKDVGQICSYCPACPMLQ